MKIGIINAWVRRLEGGHKPALKLKHLQMFSFSLIRDIQ
jgi:hypothetical protein